MPEPRPRVWADFSASMVRAHELDWHAPLRGAQIVPSSVEWASRPEGLVFSDLQVDGDRTLVDLSSPALSRPIDYEIRCKLTDTAGLVHETQPPIEMRATPGGLYPGPFSIPPSTTAPPTSILTLTLFVPELDVNASVVVLSPVKTFTLTLFTPDLRQLLPSLVAWWDFSDISTLFKDSARTDPVTTTGDIIKGVTDKSGNGNHLNASTDAGVKYLTNVRNGLSAANNEGANNQYLENGALNLGSPHACVLVGRIPTTLLASFESTLLGGVASSGGSHAVQEASSQGGGWRWTSQAGVTESVLITSHQADAWHVFVMDMDGVNNPAYIENTFDVNVAPTGAVESDVGQRVMHDSNLGSGHWRSDCGEIRLYDGEFTSSRIDVVDSLKTKWAIT